MSVCLGAVKIRKIVTTGHFRRLKLIPQDQFLTIINEIMEVRLILLFTLLAYGVIVSQSFMYILALRSVTLRLDSNMYIELRKQIDRSMRATFKYAMYAGLLLNLLLLIVTISNPVSLLFILSAVAFVALIVDTMITIKGNIPVNTVINNWTPGSHPANWSDFREKWLRVFCYRQIANITGFVSLVAGAVFG
jgi:hypothetical protein